MDAFAVTFSVCSRENFLTRCEAHLELVRRRARSHEDLKSTIAVLELAGTRELIARHGWPVREYLAGVFAGVIRRTIRVYDILGRQDGETFGILFLDCDRAEALRTIERIREENEACAYVFGGMRLAPQFRAGLVCLSDFDILPGAARDAIAVAERKMRADEGFVRRP